MILGRAATRIYKLTLRTFPARHRADYAAEMIDAFEHELRTQFRDQGAWRARRFVLAAWLNAVAEGVGERRRRRRSNSNDESGRPLLARGFGRDLVHAVRSLAKARAFSFVCVLSLGIGMATVIAILTLVRAIIGPPPLINTNGLVEVVVTPLGPLRTQAGTRVIETWSYPDFVDLRDAATGMNLTGWTYGEMRFRARDADGAARVGAMYVSPNYFATIGVTLASGAGFSGLVDGVQTEPVVVGHRFWQDRLGGDLRIIGSTIVLNRVSHVVVGITPEGFIGHMSPEDSPDVHLWIPLHQHPRLHGAESLRFNRDVDWLHVHGRLPAGTSLDHANAAVASVLAGLAKQYPKSNEFKSGAVETYLSMGAGAREDIRGAVAVFFGMSGLVLLIVCLNVSGMMLVRSATRERELALRQAIGASRTRLIQYILSEALVLAFLGGTLAVTILFGAPALLFWWLDFWHPDLDLFKPDIWTYAASVGLCFVASLVFGLLPAVRFSRPTLVSALKDDAGGGGRRVGRVHRLTAAIQAGIAVPFLVIGGVKLDQVRTTAAADVGFDTKGLFAAPLDPAAGGRDEREVPFLLKNVQENLAQASGVTSVAVADGLPLDFRYRYVRVGREGDARLVRAHTTRVTEGYFETMGIRLLRGRAFTRDDRTGSELVVILSEPLGQQLFSGVEPLGKRLVFALEGKPAHVFTVVGVTTDLVTSQMGTARPQMFLPLAQHPSPRLTLIARASASDGSMASAFKNAVADLDPDFMPSSLITGDRLMRRSMADLTIHSITAVVCASVALSLAALGVYGVVGLMVTSRTREIGVRMALGASRVRVLRTVLVDAIRVVVPGVALGLVVAVLAVRVANLPETWYALGSVEPLTYALGAAGAMLVAMIAGLPSARRAARVDPIRAMRSE
jgi:putative ABC transport system permease protein